MRKTMAGDFDESVRFFGRYTWKDLLRLGLPVAVILWWVDIPELSMIGVGLLLLPGVLIGVTWYLWRPYGEPLDVHVFHLCRWLVLEVNNS